jgi:uncharacterized membrane protein
MHLFNMATLFVVLTLVGVEFSVSAFVNPAASRLEPESQLKMLSRSALVLGKVMPVWYTVCTLFLGIQTWLCWHTPGRAILLTADAIWVLISVASIFVLVPLASRVAEGAADWQRIHRIWDRRHRVRIAALATAAVLLTYVVVRWGMLDPDQYRETPQRPVTITHVVQLGFHHDSALSEESSAVAGNWCSQP